MLECSAPLPGLETVRGRLTLGRMRLAVGALPKAFVERREERIAFGTGGDAGQIQPLRQRKRLLIQLGTADQHDLCRLLLTRPLLGALQRILETAEGFRALQAQPGLAARSEEHTSEL